MNDITTPKTHSWLSPSGFKPILDGCYGKPYMEKDFPEGEPNQAAVRGTAIHEIADHILNLIARNYSTYDQEHLEVAIGYTEYCKALCVGIFKLYSERRVDVFKDLDIFGTGDCFIWLPEENVLHMVDLKTGRLWVGVVGNWQLIAYVYGFMLEHPEIVEKNPNVVFHIFQPGNSQEPWAVPYHTILEDYLPKMREASSIAYDIYHGRIELNDALHLRINDSCQYCRARGSCSALRNHINQTALIRLEDDPFQIPRVENLSREQRIAIFRASKLFKSYLQAVEDSLLAEVTQGECTELVLQPGRVVRSWNPDGAYVATELQKLGIDPIRKDLITITEAEKLLKKRKALLPDDIFVKTSQKSRLVFRNEVNRLEQLNNIIDIEET